MSTPIPISPDEKKSLKEIIRRAEKHVEGLLTEWKEVSSRKGELLKEISKERHRIKLLQELLGDVKTDESPPTVSPDNVDLEKISTPELVYEILKHTGEQMDAAAVMEFIREMGLSRNESTVRSALRRLEKDDLPDVKRVEWGIYQYFGPQEQEEDSK